MKNNAKKVLVIVLAVCMVAVAAVGATLAWLIDTETSDTYVFTAGNVDITLEASNITNEVLIPSKTYALNPTIKVAADSQDAYVRLLVTFNKYAELKATCMSAGGDFDYETYLTGIDGAGYQWTHSKKASTATTVTYEFRYNTTVSAGDVLELPFANFKVNDLLNKEEVATLDGLTIVFEADAIQVEGNANADTAWANFDAQVAHDAANHANP